MRLPWLWPTVLLALPGVVAAAAEKKGVAGTALTGDLPWGQLLSSLALIVGLILALAWVARRFGAVRGGTVPVQVLGGMSLGARERVMLVEVAGRRLLLGVAPGRVQTLTTWEVDPEAPLPGGADRAQTQAPDFRHWLGAALRGRVPGRGMSS